MNRRALVATVPASLVGVAGCLGGQRTNPSGEQEQSANSSTESHFDITNQRDSKIELSVRLKFGQDAQADSAVNITDERDNDLEVSTRTKDGNRSFAVGDFVLDEGETTEFTARFVNMQDVLGMSISVTVLSPQATTYEQKELPVGVPGYAIRIESDGIDVIWAEN